MTTGKKIKANLKIKAEHPSFISLTKANVYGKNSVDIMHSNRALIIRLLSANGAVSRTALANRTGLKQATVSLIIKELMEAGIVEEKGMVSGENGRSMMGFSLKNNICAFSIAVHTNMLISSVFDVESKCIYRKVTKTNLSNGYDEIRDAIVEEYKLAKKSIKGKDIIGIGIGVEGPISLHNDAYCYYDRESGEFYDLGKKVQEKTDLLVVVNRCSQFGTYGIWKKYGCPSLCSYANVNFGGNHLESGIMINGEMINGSAAPSGVIGSIVCQKKEDGSVISYNDLLNVDYVLERANKKKKLYPKSALAKKKSFTIDELIEGYYDDDPLSVDIYTEYADICGQILHIIDRMLGMGIIHVGGYVPKCDRFYTLIYNESFRGGPPPLYPLERKEHEGFREWDRKSVYKLIGPQSTDSPYDGLNLLGMGMYVMDIYLEYYSH